uniref:Uncharacterized protein n=1 Tax=Rhizophora mucronata TaxID=61149 RepID=A0A2P2QAP7_RHIMU
MKFVAAAVCGFNVAFASFASLIIC